MPDIEAHIELAGATRPVGLLRRHPARGGETITFEYDPSWLKDPGGFSLEPALGMTRGVFTPARGQAIFGSIGDSAPDTWGRRLMQRSERRQAERDGRPVRTLAEADYLLGVSDEIRLADRAGIATPHHELVQVGGKAVLLSRRFDRQEGARIPFLSAMSMLGFADGERGSYPELVDTLAVHGARAAAACCSWSSSSERLHFRGSGFRP